MLLDTPSFVEYWRSFRARTMCVLDVLPAEDLEWTHAPGKYTFGDIFRHLAGIERYMYAETVQHRPSAYIGHSAALAGGIAGVRAYADRCHAESLEIFGGLTLEDLTSKCITPAGAPITVWKWLRAMVEHEAHHRGQLYMMAGIRGIPVPPLYGLTEEEVAELSDRLPGPF
ncbi:MAG TPA: DinB family protein [Thermoanaerobaculia bacterium]|nr:DinB family protein [Thermoanaerobaculia bacterium]